MSSTRPEIFHTLWLAITTAANSVTVDEVIAEFNCLYPDAAPLPYEDKYRVFIWYAQVNKYPMLAISTGRRNSLKGMLTCALLSALGVSNPKGLRTKAELGLEIIRSPKGRIGIEAMCAN